MLYTTRNPYNDMLVKNFETLSDTQAEEVLKKAAACYEQIWRRTSFAERAAILRQVAALLRARQEEFAQLATLEMGKLLKESRLEVTISADIIDYYAQHAEEFLAPQPLSTNIGNAIIESSPLGVILGIEPWNFPYYQLVRFAAPNLMAGNVVLVKPAPSVPQCAIAFADLFREVGAPAGIYTNVLLENEQIAQLIGDPRIKGVALTGSVRAGSIVAATAGKHLKKSTMELGGSDAFIVLEDADLNQTIPWAVWGRMINGGQSCVAAKRFIVVEQLADRFLARFQEALEALVPGDPMEETTTLAPLSSEAALTNLLDQVERSVAKGARVITGGKRMERTGAFMQPTILTDITTDNPAYSEEFFGPVALFFRVRDQQEAIALANDSQYGLGGAVFTADEERGKQVAENIESGMVFINHPTSTAPELPFGGIKNSGYGRELSSLGIQEFVNKKLIYSLPITA